MVLYYELKCMNVFEHIIWLVEKSTLEFTTYGPRPTDPILSQV